MENQEYMYEHWLECESARDAVANEYDRLMAAPLPVEAAVGEDLATLAAKTLSKWRPYDTRWYMAQVHGSDYSFRPSTLSGRVMKHSKVEITGVAAGVFEFGLYLDANIREFEDYDSEVRKSWHEAGKIEVDADGRVKMDRSTKHGGTATPTKSPSPHLISVPRSIAYDDTLKRPMPNADWRLKVLVTCEVKTSSGDFVIDFTAKGTLGVLMEGRVRDKNLVVATRVLLHKLFGSKDAGKRGDFLDGIRQLIAGEKSASLPTSKPEAWSKAGRSFMFVSKASLWIGFLIVLVGFLKDGWFIYWGYLLAGALVAFVGHAFSAVMVPITEAKEKETAARSIL